ncbi:uncharacterized protein [Pyrus communis]|uniref:uncharacterized protein n=1 Tax=Pyrus communis TaxID=23211 RepID=UPI0035C08AD1
MSTNEGFQGVSNCYVFKSQLQEYAQKVGMPTPVYETTKEGPSHAPSFKSTVIVNEVRYDSLPGFSNRKIAEQSAAEVALVELAKSADVDRSISQPIHETGLCKNLLQEYAQKMNYAIPLYECQKEETTDKTPLFSCTVEIGGIRYVGAVAKTKKEAEIKVARTALLAIRSSNSESSKESVGNTQLTVVPCKKRQAAPITNSEETADVPKPKKPRPQKRKFKKKPTGDKAGQTQVQNEGNSEVNMGGSEISGCGANTHVQPMAAEAAPNTHEWMSHSHSEWEPGLIPCDNDVNATNGQSTASYFNHGDSQTHDLVAVPLSYHDAGAVLLPHHDSGEVPLSYGNTTPWATEANMASGAGQAVSHASNSGVPYFEASTVTVGMKQSEDESKQGDSQTHDAVAAPPSCHDVGAVLLPYHDAGAVPFGNTMPWASEANMVPGAGAGAGCAVSHVSNSGVPYFETSTVTAGVNQSENEAKQVQHMC